MGNFSDGLWRRSTAPAAAEGPLSRLVKVVDTTDKLEQRATRVEAEVKLGADQLLELTDEIAVQSAALQQAQAQWAAVSAQSREALALAQGVSQELDALRHRLKELETLPHRVQTLEALPHRVAEQGRAIDELCACIKEHDQRLLALESGNASTSVKNPGRGKG